MLEPLAWHWSHWLGIGAIGLVDWSTGSGKSVYFPATFLGQRKRRDPNGPETCEDHVLLLLLLRLEINSGFRNLSKVDSHQGNTPKVEILSPGGKAPVAAKWPGL